MKNPTKYFAFNTKWGEALIAWNNKGICHLSLPDPEKKTSIIKIKNIYPCLEKGDPSQIRSVILKVEKYFYGKTISYSKLAKKVGNPKAARAVGSANARNMIPLIIPCHRVIKSDGGLGGFSGSGGIPTKKVHA